MSNWILHRSEVTGFGLYYSDAINLKKLVEGPIYIGKYVGSDVRDVRRMSSFSEDGPDTFAFLEKGKNGLLLPEKVFRVGGIEPTQISPIPLTLELGCIEAPQLAKFSSASSSRGFTYHTLGHRSEEDIVELGEDIILTIKEKFAGCILSYVEINGRMTLYFPKLIYIPEDVDTQL